ncbi:MAG: hypothetical protein A4E57_04023 [Syntrophorhabdaceae bacterium PtaU1.Bin034]|nr:MAG: hypothetical protein A4E57_04023 [Syntrophorhabdaceae bacterium PtaU1.Bin034]
MKKTLVVISTMFVFGISVMGCATKGDLEKVQAQEQQTSLKADEALKASREANENAIKAADAVRAAEERAKVAEERAAEAEARADRANAMFKGSMRK